MVPALELRGVVKRFGAVVANDHVDLAVEAGEIRALLGENGAGKTTLMRVAYGLSAPDAGEILVRGVAHRFRSPHDAIAAGLGMVHQHFMLFDALSVAENVVFGAEPTRLGFLDRRRAARQVAELARRYGLEVDPGARVGALPVGVRQRVEILKVLYRGADILILDEPTAVLAPRERDALFAVLRELAAGGKAVIFITHKLPEVMSLCRRATVMRDGTVTGTLEIAVATPEELARLMVGRAWEAGCAKAPARPGPPVLRVEELAVRDEAGREVVRGVSLEVAAGEIVGLAGAAGNGQGPLVEAIAGLRPAAAGRIEIGGAPMSAGTVARRRRAGLRHVPEDRDGVGLALAASVADNLLLGLHDQAPYCRAGWLRPAAARRRAERLVRDFAIRATGVRQPAAALSGGNRQKLVVARELELPGARLLLVEQPTRGVDLAASQLVHRALIARRDAGQGVLLISAELTELLALADRILVMFEGRVVGEVTASDATEEELGLLMAGGARRAGGPA